MAFSVDLLPAYVKQKADEIVASSLFDAKTQQLIQSSGNVMIEVKSAQTINVMDTDAPFQDDSGCAFNASGTTSFTQRTLTVGKIKVQEALCPKNLEASYLQEALRAGTNQDSVPFEETYMDRKSGKVAEQLEVAIWQGDTDSANMNLNKFDGFQKIIAAASGVVNANTTPWVSATVTEITAANVLSVVKGIKNAIPAKVMGKEDLVIFCGWDIFNLIVDAHVNANLFNYGSGNIQDGEFVIPGTKYKVVAVHGLDGTSDLYAIRLSNMYFGTDLVSDEATAEMWFSQDDRNVKYHLAFKAGVQIAFPSEIVKFIV